MKKLISALTATTLLFAVSCTGASTSGGTTGGTGVTSMPTASQSGRAASPSASASAAATTTGGSTTGTGTSTGTAKGCMLVSSMDAEKVVGHIEMGPNTQSGTLPGTPAQGDLCVFEGANGKLTVGVLDNVSSADFSGFTKSIPGVQQVQGIGDQAYLAKGSPSGSAAGASLLVLKGRTYLSLSTTSTTKSADDLASALQDLAKTVIDDL